MAEKEWYVKTRVNRLTLQNVQRFIDILIANALTPETIIDTDECILRVRGHGTDLSKCVLSFDDADRTWVRQRLHAMVRTMHRLGIIHADLHHENVVYHKNSAGERSLRFIDFEYALCIDCAMSGDTASSCPRGWCPNPALEYTRARAWMATRFDMQHLAKFLEHEYHNALEWIGLDPRNVMRDSDGETYHGIEWTARTYADTPSAVCAFARIANMIPTLRHADLIPPTEVVSDRCRICTQHLWHVPLREYVSDAEWVKSAHEDAVARMHNCGIVHGNLVADNVVIDARRRRVHFVNFEHAFRMDCTTGVFRDVDPAKVAEGLRKRFGYQNTDDAEVVYAYLEHEYRLAITPQ